MVEHTPGPWTVDAKASRQISVRCHNGEIICKIVHWEREIDLADASLIAAAPDLLEAARWIVTYATAPAVADEDWDLAIEELSAAIAKATEREQNDAAESA